MIENASLNARRDAKRAARLITTPESARGHFVRSWAGKASPRTAIKAQCLECQGFDRAAITDCQSFACSLWEYRPFKPKLNSHHVTLPPEQ
jgi:hypothetical protein